MSRYWTDFYKIHRYTTGTGKATCVNGLEMSLTHSVSTHGDLRQAKEKWNRRRCGPQNTAIASRLLLHLSGFVIICMTIWFFECACVCVDYILSSISTDYVHIFEKQ